VQEAKAASALNHPHIVHIYGIDTDSGMDFIAMEYVEGRTLDEVIGRQGLKTKEALRYAVQIADALATSGFRPGEPPDHDGGPQSGQRRIPRSLTRRAHHALFAH